MKLNKLLDYSFNIRPCSYSVSGSVIFKSGISSVGFEYTPASRISVLLCSKWLCFNKYYPGEIKLGNWHTIWTSLWSMRCLCGWILIKMMQLPEWIIRRTSGTWITAVAMVNILKEQLHEGEVWSLDECMWDCCTCVSMCERVCASHAGMLVRLSASSSLFPRNL